MDLERGASHPGISGDWETWDHVTHIHVTEEKDGPEKWVDLPRAVRA